MHCTTCISPAIRDDLGSHARRNDFKEQATRKHFITRQDCRNIGRKVKDFSKHRHNDDAVSVDRIVRELQQETPSPMLTYKPQGIADRAIGLPSDTFFLALMTEFQARLFQDYCVSRLNPQDQPVQCVRGYTLAVVILHVLLHRLCWC